MKKIILLICLVIVNISFSCNKKITGNNFIPKIDYKLSSDTLNVGTIFSDLLKDTTNFSISDSSSGTTSTQILFYSNTKPDTSDVIIRYVFNWEEGEIETFAGKLVRDEGVLWFGYGEGNLYKVKGGIWIPIQWPKDIVNMYIKPKK